MTCPIHTRAMVIHPIVSWVTATIPHDATRKAALTRDARTAVGTG